MTAITASVGVPREAIEHPPGAGRGEDRAPSTSAGERVRTASAFANGVVGSYNDRLGQSAAFSKSVRASAAAGGITRPTGHPAFRDLDLGQGGYCDAAVVFIDLRNFTARTFWDPPEQTVALAMAVITQIVEVVYDFGGHVLGLRGDGVFACFGEPGSDPDVDVTMALGACAFALDATESALNNLLKLSGIAPVQLRAGGDYGRLDFVRQGTEVASEINIISFPANFAAKSEKKAKSWEFVAGEGLALRIPEADLRVEHTDSPKPYQRDYEQRTYRFYDIRWRSLVPHLDGIPAELAGASTSHVRIH